MNHRSHLWLMAALAGVGMLAGVLLPGGSILALAFGIPLLACLAKQPEDRPTPAELSDALAPPYAALPKGRLAGFKVR